MVKTLYRVSGKKRMSKDIQCIFFVPSLFEDRLSAVEKAKAYIDNEVKLNVNKGAYKASIEGKNASAYNSHDAADTFSAIIYDEIYMCLNVYPVIEYGDNNRRVFSYRGYDIVSVDTETWGIYSSDFLFGKISKDNVEAALQYIDHFIFELLLQQNGEEEDE